MTSFGNMGFAKPICAKENIVWDNYDSDRGVFVHVNLSFQCERTTVITDVIDSGVLLSSALPFGYDNTLATCYSDNEQSKHMQFFNNRLNKEAFQSIILEQCKGLTYCRASVNTKDIILMRRYDGLIKMPPNLTVFAQAQCQTKNESDLNDKNVTGIAISCIGVLMLFIYQHTINYFFLKNEIMKIENDHDLISLEDFTLTCKIPKEVWTDFKGSYVEDDTNPQKNGNLAEFEARLVEQISKQLEQKYLDELKE